MFIKQGLHQNIFERFSLWKWKECQKQNVIWCQVQLFRNRNSPLNMIMTACLGAAQVTLDYSSFCSLAMYVFIISCVASFWLKVYSLVLSENDTRNVQIMETCFLTLKNSLQVMWLFSSSRLTAVSKNTASPFCKAANLRNIHMHPEQIIIKCFFTLAFPALHMC